MRAAALVLLIATVVAGCLGGNAPGPVGPESSGPTDAADVAAGQASGKTRHVHDLWDGSSDRTLIDRSIPLRPADVDPGTPDQPVNPRICTDGWVVVVAKPCAGDAEFAPEPSGDAADPNVVPPGTAEVHVTVDWPDEAIITGAKLVVETPEMRLPTMAWASGGDTRTVAASDLNASWSHFPLTMTDDGHATVSSWIFRLSATSDEPVALANASVDVTVELERTDGPLPVEPPHPSWYPNGTSTYRVALGNASTDTPSIWASWARTTDVEITASAVNPVPPGTREVVVTATVSQEGPAEDTPLSDPRATLEVATPGGLRAAEHRPDRVEGDRLIFRIPVTERMTDSVYACSGEQSAWYFFLWIRPEYVAEDPVLGLSQPGAMWFEGDVRMEASATTRAGADATSLRPTTPEEVPGCEAALQAYT